MGTLRSSDTSVLTRATRRKIPEDSILHSDRVRTSNLTQNTYTVAMLVALHRKLITVVCVCICNLNVRIAINSSCTPSDTEGLDLRLAVA
jgi:hypothetical protein